MKRKATDRALSRLLGDALSYFPEYQVISREDALAQAKAGRKAVNFGQPGQLMHRAYWTGNVIQMPYMIPKGENR